MLLEDQLKEAKLRYVSDDEKGFYRKRAGKGFYYVDTSTEKITDPEIVLRIKKLVIPPAWQNVWICAKPNGHLQATGLDERGRKQYRYHPDFSALTQGNKFDHVLEFAETLPLLRDRVKTDISRLGMPYEKVLATIVWLLENTLIRIGNKEYAIENQSYGLTTLRNRHVALEGNTITFSFKGKSGVYHAVRLNNKKVASVLRSCHEIPGQELFQYIDDDNKRYAVCSDDVNDYLSSVTGKDITAKDFRTWGGTSIAAAHLNKTGIATSDKELKDNLVKTVKTVSTNLRNTPATCRTYYIHPSVFSAYKDGYTLSNIVYHKQYERVKPFNKLDEEEQAVVAMLQVYA